MAFPWGAATTMMVAGEETPDAVVAFVEDCGYTSVWDVFSSELSLRFGLPEFPLLYSASALSSAMARYSFEEVSALEAMYELSDTYWETVFSFVDRYIGE